MTLKEALGIVLDLASENALDEIDAQESGLEDCYNAQQKALEIVINHYADTKS